MSWLLGGGVTAGIIGVVALGIYLAKMASNNRSDLHQLVQAAKDLSEARRDNDGYKRRVEERDHAIEKITNELARERSALAIARDGLDSATKKLATRGDAASVATDLNSTLRLLQEMSTPKTSEGDND